MPLISSFDPWRSSLCTCPPKLTFNPYSGCDHQCVYCYASSYIPSFSDCRPKKDLLQNLKREAAKLKGETVSIANSRPVPARGSHRWLDAEMPGNPRRKQLPNPDNHKIQPRHPRRRLAVQGAVNCSFNHNNRRRGCGETLGAARSIPEERLRAAEDLISKGIPVSVRIDPVIPFVNDNPEKLIATLASIGVKHITSSTYKIKPDNWHRFSPAMPEAAEKLKPLYFQQGEKIGGNTLLPRDLRLKLMKNMRSLAVANGMKFGVCREGLAQLNTAACDGSWLLSTKQR